MLKDRVKKAMFRAMRPGLVELNQRLDRVETAMKVAAEADPLARNGQAHTADFTLWRGGLRGRAVDAAGQEVPAMTAKYRAELEFWWDRAQGIAVDEADGPVDAVYRAGRQGRIRQLGEFLGMPQPADGFSEDLKVWCAERSAVEIGAGPCPAIAMIGWRRAVAVDPLADGYTAEGLLPKEGNGDEVVYLSGVGEAVPLPARFADIVVLENCLEDLDEPERVLRESHRLLGPGGLLWLLVDLMHGNDHKQPNPFNESRLRELLRACGFEPVKDRISKSGPEKDGPGSAGEFRGLLRKVG